MRRITLFLLITWPVVALVYYWLNPDADGTLMAPLFHFYIVTFTTFTAAVIAITLVYALGANARPRHVLAAVAFAVMGTIFFTHGLPTPGALTNHYHPALGWSAWLTLFGGGALFALASLDRPAGRPRWLVTRSIVFLIGALTLSYLAVAAFRPQWLQAINTQAGPWHQTAVFATTLILWLAAAIGLWQTWRVTQNRVDGVMMMVATWMAVATVSMHRFPLWHNSWWLYHFTLLLAFLVTTAVLIREYESLHEFRLIRYYVSLSLITTALLALVTSQLFADFSRRRLMAEMTATAVEHIDTVVQGIAANLPGERTDDETLALFASRLAELRLGRLTVVNGDGQIIYPDARQRTPLEPDKLERGLAMESFVTLYEPGVAPADYAPEEPEFFMETIAPIPIPASPDGRPIGVLRILQGVPELNQAILNARVVGLSVAASTMGGLFIGLLAVVYRADGIIRHRTRELATAYAGLRQSESIRQDLTNMVVHDLRSPLTAITTSVDLLKRLNGSTRPESQARYLENACGAALRMSRLIDDMLAVSKMEAGELTPALESTTLGDTLTDVLNDFAAQAAAERKTFTADYASDIVVCLDPALIGRTITNLISNAFKYTQPDEGIIRLSARTENGQLLLAVMDNGIGVPDDYKQRIFEKYIQAPNGQHDVQRRGIGLGLAFCRLAAEAHGGRLSIHDTPGGGSTFTLELPRHPVTAGR